MPPGAYFSETIFLLRQRVGVGERDEWCCLVAMSFKDFVVASPEEEPILGRMCSSFKIVVPVDFHTLLQYSLKMFF